jgi:hypothetical protein
MSDPFSVNLYSFSPLAQKAFLPNLGLQDKNKNGAIDRGAGEGYEEFTAKYGDADIGFDINGVKGQGARNGRLEENEIINYYYLNIRFREAAETESIERAVITEVQNSDLPQLWCDDEQGSIFNLVKTVLARNNIAWPNEPISDDEAEELFHRTMELLRIQGRKGEPFKTGYYTLPEALRYRSMYCAEVADFQFLFYSFLQKRSVAIESTLAENVYHGTVMTESGAIHDYFGVSAYYPPPAMGWEILNPLRSIGTYYLSKYKKSGQVDIAAMQKSVQYDKYDLSIQRNLIAAYFNSSNPPYQEIIAHGKFVLDNLDVDRVMTGNSPENKKDLQYILSALIESYDITQNRQELRKTLDLLERYFSDDPLTAKWLQHYRPRQ